jgi:hypothetical protein
MGVTRLELVDLTLGREIAINVFVKNSGRAPAHNTSGRVHLTVDKPFGGDRQCPHPNAKKRGFVGQFTVPIGEEFFSTPQSDTILESQQTLDLLKTGKLWIYIYGMIRYQSSNSRKQYLAEFYFAYNPVFETFSVCSAHNTSS